MHSLPSRRTLAARVLVRLSAAALLVMIANLVWAVVENGLDDQHFVENVIRTETRELVEAAASTPDGRLVVDPDADLHVTSPGYNYVRILDVKAGSELLFRGNRELLQAVSRAVSYDPRSIVSKHTSLIIDGRRIVWGVSRETAGERDAFVEVAVDWEAPGLRTDALLDEFWLHVWAPLVPSLIIFGGLAYWSVHSGLAPLRGLAQRVEADGAITDVPVDRGTTSDVGNVLVAVRSRLAKDAERISHQKQFVGRLAHELRTPLSLMMLDLAQIQTAEARRLENDVRAMASRVSNLMAIARSDDGLAPAASCDPVTVAQRALDTLRSLADLHHVRVELDVADPARIACDAHSAEEALRNLVENAIKHGAAQSVVDVHVRGTRVLVRDRGGGFVTLDEALLCAPFWKAADTGDGSGLGLAVVRQVADRCGATLHFANHAEGGGCVELRFRHG